MTRQTSMQWRLTGAAALASLLTSLCLTPTLGEGQWGLRTIATVVTVAATGGLLRQWAAPRWLIPLVQLVALLIVATLMFTRTENLLGIVPTLDSVRALTDLSSDAMTTLWNEEPPVALTDAVALAISVGVGFVALVVDALAVTYRRPTLSGIPLFILYLVPAAVLPEGVPWPLFALAGAGWILIQLVDGRERLTHWGRVVGTDGGPGTGGTALTGSGRRLGATALVAAIAIPMVMPSIGEGVFGTGGTAEGNSNRERPPNETAEKVVTVNPIVDLRRDLTRGEDDLVFRYATTDLTPQYWRIATLDQFDGFTWTLAESSATESQQAAAGLATPPGLSESVARTTQVSDVEVTALNSKRLPLPYPTTRVDIEGDWRYDPDTLDVFSAAVEGNALGQRYRAESLDLQPSSDQLLSAPAPSAEMDYYLIVPPDISQLIGPQTDTVLAGETNPYLQAQLLQNWFRSKFEYSLDGAEGNDTSDLAAFLDDRSGYCEQFAATMALMARQAGIPSRVQVGFTPGTQLEGGTWEVSAHDAHAWPELWFEGVGWVRFEPTPGGGDGNATPAWAPPPPSEVANPQNGPDNAKNPPLRRNPGPVPDDFRKPGLPALDRTGSGLTPSAPTEPTGPDRRWLVLFVLALASVALVAPAVTRRMTRIRRWRAVTTDEQAIAAAWQEVLDAATDVDLAPQPTQTPRDLSRWLPKASGMAKEQTQTWQSLCDAIERQRYGVVSPAETGSTNIEAWRSRSDDLTRALLNGVTAADRRRALWWPSSGRRDLTAGWNRIADAVATTWQELMSGMTRRLRRS